jgi:hypothetical protein
MNIEKIVSIIRKSDIGNIMYKIKPTGNFLGVYGLKSRPKDTEFLETGDLIDIDNATIVNKSYTLFRNFIPKDFAVISTPKFWIKTSEDNAYPINEYHLVDIDIYAYLLVLEGIKSENIPINTTNFNNLFYLDGRKIDYSSTVMSNIHKYSLILGDKSNITPYIYKKINTNLFSESCADDFLINSCGFNAKQIEVAFEQLNIFSNIKEQI